MPLSMQKSMKLTGKKKLKVRNKHKNSLPENNPGDALVEKNIPLFLPKQLALVSTIQCNEVVSSLRIKCRQTIWTIQICLTLNQRVSDKNRLKL